MKTEAKPYTGTKPGRKPKTKNRKMSAFGEFHVKAMHSDVKKRNDIYYKGSKIFKFEAFAHFKTYENMINNPNVRIETVEY